MPLFEFHCAGCDARFEDLVPVDRKPDCPKCGSHDVEKLLSAFAVGRGGGGGSRRQSAAPAAPA